MNGAAFALALALTLASPPVADPTACTSAAGRLAGCIAGTGPAYCADPAAIESIARTLVGACQRPAATAIRVSTETTCGAGVCIAGATCPVGYTVRSVACTALPLGWPVFVGQTVAADLSGGACWYLVPPGGEADVTAQAVCEVAP